MGSVDQSDVKATVMNLTRQTVRKQHQKQMSFLIESAITNAHANYNLDPNCEKQNFTDWHNHFVQELIDLSPNFRKYKSSKARKREMSPSAQNINENVKQAKLSHHKRVRSERLRRSTARPYGSATKAGLECPGRSNLAAFLRFAPSEGSCATGKPKPKEKKCAFCGKRRTMFKCAGCHQHFCMTPPIGLIIPGCEPRTFRSNGPSCWQLLHGFRTFGDMVKQYSTLYPYSGQISKL